MFHVVPEPSFKQLQGESTAGALFLSRVSLGEVSRTRAGGASGQLGGGSRGLLLSLGLTDGVP